MNPSSLEIDLSAVQSQKDMNRNRLGDELGETNKWFRSMLVDDEGSPSTIENILFCEATSCQLLKRYLYYYILSS
jgi:hypothetical protein